MANTEIAELLLERDAELATVERSLRWAMDGDGSLLAVEGEPGIGKSRLLRAVHELGREQGFGVLRAIGSELERDFAFGVVGQLIDPVLVGANDQARAEIVAGPASVALSALRLGQTEPSSRPSPAAPGPAPELPILHGLYWLIANLCKKGSLVVTVDDAQWADRSSLSFLTFLSTRLAELPVLVVCAVRSGEDQPAVLQGLLANPACEIVGLRALSEQATDELVRHGLSQDVAPEFSAACHRATGGNPFLLDELLTDLRSSGTAPTAQAAPRIAELAPRAVSLSVLVRLARLPAGAQRLAQAIAVLGDGCDPKVAASLADVAPAEAVALSDMLRRARILDDVSTWSFKHPLLRSAVQRDMDTEARGVLRARAADLLRKKGAAPHHIATQLLEAPPRGDATAVKDLRRSARLALDRGAGETAVAFLQRALEEPPTRELRTEVLGELGAAELRAGDISSSERHLKEALATGPVSPERVSWVLELFRATWFQNKTESIERLKAEIAEAEKADLDLAVLMEVSLMQFVNVDRELMRHVRDERIPRLRCLNLPRSSPSERLVQAQVSYFDCIRIGQPAPGFIELASRVMADGRLLSELTSDSILYWVMIMNLIRAEAFDAAADHASAGIADAQTRGSALAFTFGSAMQSLLELRRGNITDALAASEVAYEAARTNGILAAAPHGLAFLAHALIERGETERAQTVLDESGLSGEVPDNATILHLFPVRGWLKVERGDLQGGVDDLLEGRKRAREFGYVNPANFPDPIAAPALARLGRSEEALALARKDLELARRWGAPGQIGDAARVLGIVEGGPSGTALLAEAVETLAGSQRRLEHARALVDLGSALRRAGRRADARRHLREGHEVASTCGSVALAERAQQELAATGARARRVTRRGIDELTASERRVAEMAAEGMSNPEIAAALFVTTKTIETHLSHVYLKLGISSRWKLRGALSVRADADE